MKEVLIPVQGPVFCSWGMLGAKRRYDYTKSFFMEQKNWDVKSLNNMITNMKKVVTSELFKLGVSLEDCL